MIEGTHTTAHVLAAKLLAALGAGTAGALIMAAVDPPATRWQLFLRALVAGVSSIFVTPIAVLWLDSVLPWIELGPTSTVPQVLEVFLPVAFLIGAMSWGLAGAMARFSAILRERAAERIARAAGMQDDQGGKS